MKKRRFSRFVRFLLFVPILVILLLVASGTPGQIQAREKDHFACWTSGPLSEGDRTLARDTYKWGDKNEEFVVDQRDLGDGPRFNMKLYPEYLGGVHEWNRSLLTEPDGLSEAESDKWEDSLKVYTLFDSVPELVDYVFALDVFPITGPDHPDRDIFDRRVRLLATKIAGRDAHVFGSTEDQRMLLPWQGGDAKEKYLGRRSTGAYYEAVKSLSTEWIDPSNPGGGRAVDSVALAQDQAANDLELAEGTITMAGDGGVAHYGTTEGIGQQVLFHTTNTCSGTACTEVTTYSNNPVPIVLHSNVYEQNDGQIDRNTGVKDERRILVKTGLKDDDDNDILTEVEYEFDPAENAPSSTLSRDAGQGGYSRMHQEDTSSDEIRISLVLEDKYRRDIEDYDPDKGDIFTSRGLPAMGIEPWTYARFESGRHHSLNDWNPNEESDGGNFNSFTHMGYRQPGLDRPVGEGFPAPTPGGSSGLARLTGGLASRWDPKQIKWPVNFEDLNWYLYKLPGDYRESLWLYWLTDDGTERVVFSGYGKEALPFPVDDDVVVVNDRMPVCTLPRNREHDYDEVRPPPLNVSEIVCKPQGGDPAVVDWDFDDLREGTQPGVHFPFDASDSAAHLLSPELLVKQGVERAVDVHGPHGTRKLSRFDFSILESQPMGESPPEEDGYLAERFYGVPQDSDERTEYLDNWRSAPIDPNRPHLMVFTFYEARQEGDLKFKIGPEDDDGEVFQLPKRQIRRVICRAMIHPSGLNPSAVESKGWWDRIVDGVKSFFSNTITPLFGGWLSKILASIAEVPRHLGIRTTELVCSGLGKLDDLTSLGNVSGPPLPALVDKEGRIRVNAAVKSKLEGSKRCHRISSPPVSTCEQDADQILEGKCVRLPEFKLQVRTAEFIRPLKPSDPADPLDPDPPDPVLALFYDEYRVEVPVDSYYAKHGEPGFVSVVNAVKTGFDRPSFDPVADLTLDPPKELHNRNRGLTRVYLDWDLRWDTISTDFYDSVDGFAVVLHPDQKSVPYPVPEKGLPPFFLPKWVNSGFRDDDDEDEIDYRLHTRVEGFAVGGLDYYPDDDDNYRAGKGSDSVTHWTAALGATDIKSVALGVPHEHYKEFNSRIHNMPLAPGFTHGFQVAPYVGVPDDPAFQMGPLSKTLWLSGDQVACDVWGESTAVKQDMADIRKLYDCRAGGAMADLGYTDDEFRPGLLALTGTDICDDIFSSTPAGFTWDNAVVKQVWGMIWIIAGAVLFTLLVWQGLRMTYDIWLDPQPAIGFRELVPRFLLAVLLAAGSLVICRMVLVVASDLTCFVAQVTGMSLWGVVGVTFGSLVDGYLAWVESLGSASDTLLFLLANFLIISFFGFIVLMVTLYLLYLFAKVVLAMLMRIALLAVLVALSPLAFAFYASDATAHWTKKWVSMFLGATVQQVIVLLVIYIGVSMLGNYLSLGAEDGLTSLLVGMIIAFVTLSLATAVPDIVNPGGKGVFGSFTQMMTMTMAAAMVVASAGVGAVVGGVGAIAGGVGAMRGASGVASSGGGNVSGGGGPSPGGGPSSGGGPGGGPGSSPASPSTGGGIISSVNRSPMGGMSVVPGGGGIQPSGQPQPSGTQPSGTQPSGAQPSGTQPSGTQPSGTQPSGTQPSGTQTPGSQTPASQTPASQTPGTQPSGFVAGHPQPIVGPGTPSSQPSGSQPSGAQPPGFVVRQTPAGVGPSSVPDTGPAATPSSPDAGAPRQQGFVSRVASGVVRGGMRGARWGSGMNLRAKNLASGSSFYRHSSRGDDAAAQVEKLREEQSGDRTDMKNFYKRIADALDPQGGGSPGGP